MTHYILDFKKVKDDEAIFVFFRQEKTN